ncbi:MAG: DUF4097 family beta strand repeat-containing protein [Gemmatimonadota bacterium]|nr:DUF4097 family beta strand repeat-containing protein [Gemmatimonadota bacterium]
MQRWMIVSAVVLLAAPAVAAAQDDFNWRGRVAAGRTVEVKGVNGDIRAEAASGDQVEVTATKTARRSDPETVTIEVVEHAGGVTICAVYPTPSNSRRQNECAPGGGQMNVNNNDVQVDFVVRLPANVRLDAGTVNGSVEAEGLRGDVEARSVNGSVSVVTTGAATAESVNGNVRMSMGRADWEGERRAASVNGNVVVVLPANANVEVHGSTVNGGIESDFPVTVRGRWGPRRMTGTIGSGGRELELETVNGEIEIRRGT